LRIDVRLLGHKALQVDAVQLRKLGDRALRVFGKLLGVADQLPDTGNGVHALHLPILLVRRQDFVQRVKPLAIVRVFLLFLRDVALLLFPEPMPRLSDTPVFRVPRDLAERLLVRLAPNARGLKGREVCRDRRRISGLVGRGGRVRAGGFNRRLQVIAQ